MLRFLRYIAEFLAAIVGIIIILAGLLAWRLSAKPVSSAFLTPYLESGVETIIPDSKVSVESSLLSWDNADHSLSMLANGIKINDGQGNAIADIDSLHASVSVFGLLFGQFMPEELTVTHPQIKLERGSNGQFSFGGKKMGSADASAADDNSLKNILRNVFDHFDHAVLMRRLAVTDAIFDVHDEKSVKSWTASIPEISIKRAGIREIDDRLEIGALEGRMTVNLSQQDHEASVDVHYVYEPLKKKHNFSTEFKDVTPSYLAGGHPETLGLDNASIIDLPLSGSVELSLNSEFTVDSVAAHIHGDDGKLIDADLWDKPLSVKTFDFNADYDGVARTLSVTDTHIDLNGPTIDLTVDGTPPAKHNADLDFTLTAHIANFPMNRYDELCPKPVLPDPRYWLVANLRDGMFTHGDASVKGSLAWDDLAHIDIAEGDGKLSAAGARVTYLDGMPPAEGVNAEATFDLKKMAVLVTGGGIGAIRMQPFTVTITGLDAVDQDIDIPAQITGPVPDIMRLIDHKPLGYAKALGISPDDIQGAVAGGAEFKFPLLKNLKTGDLDIKANATATGVASTKLVPGIAIDQGNFALTLDMDGVGMKGPATLNKVPMQIIVQQNFEAQQGRPLRAVKVSGAIKDNEFDNFGIPEFDGSKGPMNLTLDIVNPDKKTMKITGMLDMTPAAVSLNMLNWKKAAGAPAVLKFKANAPDGQDVAVTSLDLRGDHVSASGAAKLSADLTHVLAADLTPLIMGRTNATIHYTQTIDGNLTVGVSGAALDITGFRAGDKDAAKAPATPQNYKIQIDHLYTSVNGRVDSVKGMASRDARGWQAIDLRGFADGNSPLMIELTPQPDGHRTLIISSDDFGKMMKGLGFTDTIKGGQLSINGQSTLDDPTLIAGHAKITAFTVEKLPVLALLLNTMSPFGFNGILTDSTDFSRFEGDFNWQGDTLTLTRAHAAGSAVGINIDGKVDMTSGAANLQGNVVPFSVINKGLNYIPIIGDIITGGEDQGVLAVAYHIKGSLASPEISVNPISLLTPGFIRNLFFRDDAADDH